MDKVIPPQEFQERESTSEQCVHEERFQPSPKWHEEVLRKTLEDFEAGKIEVIDWEDAQEELRKRFG